MAGWSTPGASAACAGSRNVAQVREGFECGVGIAGYNDVKIGDIIEAFREEQVSPVAD